MDIKKLSLTLYRVKEISPADQAGSWEQKKVKTMKTEKQIWMERETAKIEKQNLSEETKKRMLEMIKDFSDWLFKEDEKMIIYELQADTGYTGLIVSVRGTYLNVRGYDVLARRAFEIYREKVEADPKLAKYKLRLVIWKREADDDGIFRLVSTTYEDYEIRDGAIAMVKCETFFK